MLKFIGMLQDKIKRYITKIFNKVVVHNKHLRPKGKYFTIQEYIGCTENAECQEVFPSYTSYLEVSEDFRNNFANFVATPHIAQIPAMRIVSIPNGRVHTDKSSSVAIISGNNKLIGEISFDFSKANPLDENNIFEQTFFHKPKKFKGTVFTMLIGGGGILNYSHFLYDSVARIAMLKKSGWYDEVDWFLVPSCKRDYQRDALRMLGIDESKVIQGDIDNHIQADRLIATTYTRYHDHIPTWCCQFLRDEFLKFNNPFSETIKNSPYVYVSRNDSDKRRVLNEPKLMNMLGKYGFKSFELAKLSFQDKISLFASAKIIIATIGAGQANLVFCESGTNVIELMPKDFTQPFFNDLSNKVNLNYDYLICRSDGHAQNIKQGEKLNLIADINEIEKRVQKILNEAAVSVLP